MEMVSVGIHVQILDILNMLMIMRSTALDIQGGMKSSKYIGIDLKTIKNQDVQ